MAVKERTVRIELLRRHAAQDKILSERKRFNVPCCGRRFGKDILCIHLTVEEVMRGRPVGWFAPTYKQLTEDWRMLVDKLGVITARKDEQERRLELWNGAVVDCWSLDRPETIRGRKYGLAVINEAGSVGGLEDIWTKIIRPTLSDLRGEAWFPSTPRGFNFFKVLFDRGQDGEQSEWASWQFPTGANPFIHPEEIAAARSELPEAVFAQEYLAEFISDETSVFRRLREAAVCERREAVPGHLYAVGCDWGKLQDFSVFSVMDLTTSEQVWLDRSNRLEYQTQVGRLKALCERYKPIGIIAESNAMGEAIIENVRRAGLRVTAWPSTQSTKQRMIEELSLAFERGSIKVLKDATQLAELQAFEATRTPTGMMKYGAPPGQHDDTVIALGLAWLATKRREPVRVREFAMVRG